MRSESFERPIVWSYHPFILETIRPFNIGSLIYHCVDDLSAIPGIDANSFNTEEQRFLTKANVTFVTSPALFDKCSRTTRTLITSPTLQMPLISVVH